MNVKEAKAKTDEVRKDIVKKAIEITISRIDTSINETIAKGKYRVDVEVCDVEVCDAVKKFYIEQGYTVKSLRTEYPYFQLRICWELVV